MPRARMVRLRRRAFFSARMGRPHGTEDLPRTGSLAPPAARGKKRQRRGEREAEEEPEADDEEEERVNSIPLRAAAAGGGEQKVHWCRTLCWVFPWNRGVGRIANFRLG